MIYITNQNIKQATQGILPKTNGKRIDMTIKITTIPKVRDLIIGLTMIYAINARGGYHE